MSSIMRRLIHLPLSPFCRKIRLVLAEKKLQVDLVEEPVWERRIELIRLNPAAMVPVLKNENLILSESNAIFESGMKNLKFHIEYLDWILQKRRWLAGDNLTIADFSAAAHFSSLDYIGTVDWEMSVNIKDWYVKLKSRPAFRSLLADLVPGFTPPPYYSDLDF